MLEGLRIVTRHEDSTAACPRVHRLRCNAPSKRSPPRSRNLRKTARSGFSVAVRARPNLRCHARYSTQYSTTEETNVYANHHWRGLLFPSSLRPSKTTLRNRSHLSSPPLTVDNYPWTESQKIRSQPSFSYARSKPSTTPVAANLTVSYTAAGACSLLHGSTWTTRHRI